MFHQIPCPSCDAPIQVPEERQGRTVECDRCGTVFKATETRREGPKSADELGAEMHFRSKDTSLRRPRRRRDENYDGYENEEDDARWALRPVRRTNFAVARSRVKGPAIFLMVYSILIVVCGLIALIPMGYYAWKLAAPARPLQQIDREEKVMMIVISGVFAFCLLTAGPVIFYGALRMKALRSYRLAITATILGSVVGFAICVALLVVGIWPFVVLLNPEVRAAFDQPRD
jgi:hypothetical protein